MMTIRPIKTEPDYDTALSEIERLWGAPKDTPEGDHLDVLLVLVENYESEHYAINPPDPVEAIKFRMEQMNITRKDLEPIIGSRGRVSEIFNRKRSLTLPMIRRLHNALRIPLESLVRESRLRG